MLDAYTLISTLGEREFLVLANRNILFREMFVTQHEEVNDKEIEMRLEQTIKAFWKWYTKDRRREVQDEYTRQRKERREAYNEFMHSETWAHLRNIKLQFADYRCERCGDADRLEVHHLTYDRFGGDELLTDLQVLCHPCHEDAHGRKFGVGYPERDMRTTNERLKY